MSAFLTFTIAGIAAGCVYALTASGLVVTYTTSGIFNFAHGAIGMVMAFVYWGLTQQWHWPQVVAILVIVGVLAPAFGVAIQFLLVRGLYGATVSTQLVVTSGLLVTLLGLATTVWKPGARTLPELFAGHQVRVFSLNVTYHQCVMIAVTLAVAVLLRLFLFRTRIGTAMRGVVDDPELASLNGADPNLVAAAAWAIGCSLAAIAGILLAPQGRLDQVVLTLLVINGYAAAMVGKLKSLPLTFAGGIVLGLAQNYAVWKLPTSLQYLNPVIPTILLFIVLLVLPQARLKAGRVAAVRKAPRVAGRNESLAGAAALIGVGFVASRLLGPADLTLAGQGMVYAIIMLSLVLLTGYAGQTSLAQLTFVGLGAFCMGKYFGGASPLGILLAALVCAVVGAIVALPALRLQGLYLALSTLAFAQGMSFLFFNKALGTGGRLAVGRPEAFGISFAGDRAYFVLLCATFAVFGVGVLALRRGRFGRMLVAMKDSPAACATLGINITVAKLAVFAISSAIAGVGGAFYGGLRTQIGPADFEALNSVVLLLLVSVSGISTVTGALFGGLTFGLTPKLQQLWKGGGNVAFLGSGLGALAIGRNPYGWTSEFAGLRTRILAGVARRREPAPAPLEVGTLVD